MKKNPLTGEASRNLNTEPNRYRQSLYSSGIIFELRMRKKRVLLGQCKPFPNKFSIVVFFSRSALQLGKQLKIYSKKTFY
jgi:hypothetical protein